MSNDRDREYMALALAEARNATQAGEVPVGAVLVRPGMTADKDEVLAQTHNQPIGRCDPTAHAEVLALREAATKLGNYRLDGCELYVTLEPCAMCAQALLHARIARVIYGAKEPKTGADGSAIELLQRPDLNHQTKVTSGVLAEDCAAVMQSFFAGQRQKAKQSSLPLRDDALRTPENDFAPIWDRFPNLQTCQKWGAGGGSLNGLRLHWLDLLPDVAATEAPIVVALHSPDAWWPQWLAWAQRELKAGYRVWLPDLIGFGQSDKPKKTRWHTLARHADVLSEWLLLQGTEAVRLVVTPEQQPLAHAVRQRCVGINLRVEVCQPELVANLPADWKKLPYPDPGHTAGQRAWPWPNE